MHIECRFKKLHFNEVPNGTNNPNTFCIHGFTMLESISSLHKFFGCKTILPVGSEFLSTIWVTSISLNGLYTPLSKVNQNLNSLLLLPNKSSRTPVLYRACRIFNSSPSTGLTSSSFSFFYYLLLRQLPRNCRGTVSILSTVFHQFYSISIVNLVI